MEAFVGHMISEIKYLIKRLLFITQPFLSTDQKIVHILNFQLLIK